MSGSGMIARPVEPRRTAEHERADVLAYIGRLRINAETMASSPTGFEEQGRERARLLEVIEEYVGQGLHEGEAEAQAAVSAKAPVL